MRLSIRKRQGAQACSIRHMIHVMLSPPFFSSRKHGAELNAISELAEDLTEGPFDGPSGDA